MIVSMLVRRLKDDCTFRGFRPRLGSGVNHPACMYEVKTEHDFTQDPRAIEVGSAESLLRALSPALMSRV